MPLTPLRLALATLLLLAVVGLGWWVWTPQPAPPAEEEHAYSGAYEALAQWTSQRAYPGFDLPSEGYAQAVEARRALEASRRGGEAWETLGPHNFGGRMLAIDVNSERPETIWAGSASGGLWRTYSGGVGPAAWERVSTGFGVLAASAVAIAPDDTSTVWLGTGEVYRYQGALGGVVYRPTRGAYGMGILKTTDGGATWTKSLDWSRSQERGVQMIKVDPSNSQNVWAATTEGVYLTTDGGATWEQKLDVVMATDVTIDPTNGDDVIAACGNQESPGYGLYRTTDGGETWAQLTNGVPPSYIGKVLFDRHPTEAQTVYASVGDGIFTSQPTSTTLIKTTDGGASWETVTTFDYARYQGWFAHYVGVSPLDPDLVIAAGVDLYRSTDGGVTLSIVGAGGLPEYPPIGGTTSENYIHVDHHAMDFHPTDPNILYFANDGGIWRSLDAGQTFQDLNGGLQTVQYYSGISVSPEGDYGLGGLQDNGTIRYEGTLRHRRVFGGDGSWTAINPDNPDIAYVSFQRLSIRRSTSGADPFTFNNVAPPSASNTSFIAPYALAASNPNVMYAGRSVVFRSSNGGLSWSATNGGAAVDPNQNPALTLSVSPVDQNVVYVSTAPILRDPADTPGPPRLFVSRVGGSSWTDITAGLPDRFVTDIAIHPTNDAIAVVTLGGFGTPHVYKTTDSGTTWTDITGSLPDAPTTSALFDPLFPSDLYVGNDVGVFKTSDDGATWESFSTGLPDAVMAMDLVYSPSDRTIHVGTYGNGRYRASLGPPPLASDDGTTPVPFTLEPATPNPFQTTTTLRYTLDAPRTVRLEVFDTAGRRVALLAEGPAEAGEHVRTFSAGGLAAGVYVVRLTAGDAVQSQRVTVVR